ncbi:unnamed protein product [Staurois parvus]|uniref:BAAT/Acyl-CoA thioester hydrolase C-terminal domain-containing protein n=1 Tax=Staurois parvus TaxID=386267 RepID=A0ABN9GDT3_9NEOB|nr:unnamed protein product [Staurois parvus]
MTSFLKGITAAAVVNGSVANIGADLHYKDITLPAIGFNRQKIKFPQPGVGDIRDIMDNPLEEPNRQSLIPVGRADCKFLFIVGEDDRNWRATFMPRLPAKFWKSKGKKNQRLCTMPKLDITLSRLTSPCVKLPCIKLLVFHAFGAGNQKHTILHK